MEFQKQDQRQRLADTANAKSIIEVAQTFGMNLHKSGQTYKGEWEGHDTFSLNPRNNRFYWNGKGLRGGSADLVSVLKYGAIDEAGLKVNFSKSVVDLNQTTLSEFDFSKVPKPEAFRYFFKEETDSKLMKEYLHKERGLSEETIRFFETEGLIAQSTWKTTEEDGTIHIEPVVLFKNLDLNRQVIGGTAQGIEAHSEWEGHTHKSGHLKKAMPHSGSNSGLKLILGVPKRLIVLEAPIDLMSYYELHKENLKDVILLASDGYKPDAYWQAMAEIMVRSPLADNSELTAQPVWAVQKFMEKREELYRNYQAFITMSDSETGRFTFAYDNDTGGHQFVERFTSSFPEVKQKIETDFPPLVEGQEKSDWNDELKMQKGLLPRPQAPSEQEKIEAIVKQYAAPIPPKEVPTKLITQSKYLKQTATKTDEKGKSSSLTKIYELLDLTNIEALMQQTGNRVTLEVVWTVTIENQKVSYQSARESTDKMLKNSRYLQLVNVAKEELSSPTREEIQALRQGKNGGTISLSPKKANAPQKSSSVQSASSASSDLMTLLNNREVQGVKNYLAGHLQDFQNPQKFEQFLNLLATDPAQSEKNIRLLLAQNPNVQKVADFNTWSVIEKRQIKPKSKALRQFIPKPIPKRDAKGQIVVDKNGQPELLRVEEQLGAVFDVNQTFGEEIQHVFYKTLPREKAVETFKALCQLSSFPVKFVAKQNQEGRELEQARFDESQQMIKIEKDLTSTQALQALSKVLLQVQFQEKGLSPEIQTLKVAAMNFVFLRQLGIEVSFESSDLLPQIPLVQFQPLLEKIQNQTLNFSKQWNEVLHPSVKKESYQLSFKEKMAAAKIKQAELLEVAEASKKVQGVEVPPPTI